MPLFGKKNKESKIVRQPPASASNETTYFGQNLKIKGRVSGNGNLIILGRLNGEFRLKGRLKIAQPAQIRGDLNADVISVNGNVHGSLTAHDSVQLEQTARVDGRINTPKLSILEGAVFNGEVNMGAQGTTPAKSAAADKAPSAQVGESSAEKSTTS
jgi:cytoskeletal protein CcmA (bactofilin family)